MQKSSVVLSHILLTVYMLFSNGFSVKNKLVSTVTLKIDGESSYLELIEIAPLEHIRGSYEDAPSSYKPYDFAEYILSKLMGKSNKYQNSTNSDIVCTLMYFSA